MFTQWLEQGILYDGLQLRSGWIKETSGLAGDSIVAFCGGADVPIEHMVDLEDVAANAPIFSEAMLHFIVEIFDRDLEKMVLRQRLLIAILLEELKKFPACGHAGAQLERRGNDLYDGKAKLSVSVATTSPVSALIHTGINISNRNTPVKTKGLNDYDIGPKNLALAVMARFAEEMNGAAHATRKVRPVA